MNPGTVLVSGFCFVYNFLYISIKGYKTMKETTAILINGDHFEYEGDATACPCCLNGSMVLKENNGESLVFECVKCRTTMTIPYVSLKEKEDYGF